MLSQQMRSSNCELEDGDQQLLLFPSNSVGNYNHHCIAILNNKEVNERLSKSMIVKLDWLTKTVDGLRWIKTVGVVVVTCAVNAVVRVPVDRIRYFRGGFPIFTNNSMVLIMSATTVRSTADDNMMVSMIAAQRIRTTSGTTAVYPASVKRLIRIEASNGSAYVLLSAWLKFLQVGWSLKQKARSVRLV